MTRFGIFQVNLETGELWKQGRRIGLQGQPFQVLALLLRRAGGMVTREELRRELWPADTYGEFDEGLNTAIRKVRRALGDDAVNPRFIETLARRGYRFIAPVNPEPPPAAPPGPSIAVLPFENIGGGSDGEIFGDGLAEDLINALAQVPGLKITARTSAFAFKGRREDVRKIGETLGVQHVLEGGVRKAGNRIRVNARLIDVAGGAPIWSERFDRDLTDVFAIQDEISHAILEGLKINIAGLPGKSARVRPGTANHNAYRAMLEGRHFMNRPSRANLLLAEQSFARALELDSAYALAHAGLAESLLFQAYQRFGPHTEARNHAERAIQLDPQCAEAYVALAQVDGVFEYDWKAASTSFERAAQLNPSSAEVWDRWGVLYYRVFGRLEEALAAHQRAVELDPLAPFPRTNVAFTLHLMGRHELAVEHARTLLELFPDGPLVQHHACLIYHAAGLLEDARAMARRGVESDPGHLLGWASGAYLVRGTDEAAGFLANLESLARRQAVIPSLFCLPYIALGDSDRALEWAKRAFDEHDGHFLVEFRDPCFAPLRDNPGFVALLRAAGIA